MANASIENRLFRGEQLSVKMFGAVQDGSTDDRAAIQSAFDFAASRNVPLLIPGGNPFLAGGQLTIPSGLIVRGRAGAVLKQKDGSAANDTAFLLGTNAQSVKMSSLTIDGNRSNQPGISGAHGLYFTDPTGVELTDLTVKAVSGDGIGGIGWRDFLINSPTISDWGYGNTKAGIYLHFTGARSSSNVHVRNPQMDGTASGSCIKLQFASACPLSNSSVRGGFVKTGYPALADPSERDVLAVEYYSNEDGNYGSDILVDGVVIDSELAPGVTYGKSWGVSFSQVLNGAVRNCIVKNAGYFFIELIGSHLSAIGNQGYNVGTIAAIVSAVMTNDQERIQIHSNQSVLREGALPSSVLAAVQVYAEGTANLRRVSVKHNKFAIQGAQYGVWGQNNGGPGLDDLTVEGNEVVGDGDPASIAYVFQNDGAGTFARPRARDNYAENVAVMMQRSVNVTYGRLIENIPGPSIGTVYGGTADATEMIVDIAHTEGKNFAPPSVQMRGRQGVAIDSFGRFFLDELNDTTHFATARPGLDSNPNPVYVNRANFSTELQGTHLSVNSYFNGFPNWAQGSTSTYARAMFMILAAARWGIGFNPATNANGADPGAIALQVIDGNNTLSEPQRVGTGVGFPFEFEQSGRMVYVGMGAPAITTQPGSWYIREDATDETDLWYVYTPSGSWIPLALQGIYSGTGSPEGVITAPVGKLYEQKDGGHGEVLWVKESGSGNTGWKSDGGTAFFKTSNGFRTNDSIGLGVDADSTYRFRNAGGTSLDGDVFFRTLTVSRPLKLNGSGIATASQINLASANDVTGSLATANGGWDESRVAALESAVTAIQAILAPGVTNSIDPSAVTTLEFQNGIFIGNT